MNSWDKTEAFNLWRFEAGGELGGGDVVCGDVECGGVGISYGLSIYLSLTSPTRRGDNLRAIYSGGDRIYKFLGSLCYYWVNGWRGLGCGCCGGG